MNKNTKKFVVTLLSVLMVLSFMPAMAFAGQSAADFHTAADWDDGTEVTPATCADPYAVVEYKCKTEGCEASYKSLKATAHKWSKKNMTVVKIVEAAINQNATPLTNSEIDAIYAYYLNGGYCCANVFVCDDCGTVDVFLNASHRIRSTQDLGIGGTAGAYYVFPTTPDFSHSDPKPACIDEYVCEFCGQTVVNSTPAAHKYDAGTTVVKENVCGYTSITIKKCSECGYEDVTKVGTPTTHDGLPTAVTPTAAEIAAKTYVEYDSKYYPSNFVAKKPTCTTEGKGGLKCTRCGDTLVGATDAGASTIAKVDHVIETKSYPATCYNPARVVERCVNCGSTTTTSTGTPLDHKYKINVITEPTCYAPGITLVECENCGRFATSVEYAALGAIDLSAHVANGTGKLADNLYFHGFTDELDPTEYMLINPWTQKNHDWGTYVDAAEATCTEPAKQARKCSVCGLYDMHHVNEVGEALGHNPVVKVVKPTCGDYGWTEAVCSRCGDDLDKDGKGFDDPTQGALSWDKTEPVVAYGTPCKFAWGDLDENTEAEICTVCGAVKAGTETPKTEEKKAKEAAEAAKPVISAAADIISDAANYTDASVKAIEEAKANLNVAISAGSADQIRQRTAELQAAVNAAEKKAESTLKASGKTVKAKANKKTTFKKAKAFKVSGAAGKVTFKKKSGNAKVTVSSAGKVTVKKGLKKGKTYKVKVTVTDAGSATQLGGSKVVTLKVKVK